MNSYSLGFKRSALKALSSLPKKDVGRISAAIIALALDPRPTSCKKLKGFDGVWRIRIGDYRVLYTMNDGVLVVEIVEVVARKNAYSAFAPHCTQLKSPRYPHR